MNAAADPLKDLPRLDEKHMGPCIICKRQLLETELPIFFRIEAKQCGLDAAEIRRHAGLAMQLGGGPGGLALAGVMGPGVKPVIVMDAITPFNVCHQCVVRDMVPLIDAVGRQWEADRQAKGLSVPGKEREGGDDES